MKQLFVFSIICLTAGLCLAGSTIYVDDNAFDDPGPGDPAVSDPAEDGTQAHPFDAIQEAIDLIVITDPNIYNEVIILPGTYTGDGNRDIDFNGKAITVRGTDPDDPNVVAATIIDCEGTEAQPHRGFYFHTGETENSVLKGLTITNGYGLKDTVFNILYSIGGGIYVLNCSPTIKQVTASDCTAQWGAGVFLNNSAGLLTSCTVINNDVLESGGGATVYNSQNLRVEDCSFLNNTSHMWGGGLFWFQSEGRISDSRISKNAARSGGGLLISHSSSLSVISSTIDDNLSNATVPSLQAGGGGGISIRSGSDLRLEKSILSGNRSESVGGGIYVNSSNSVISNCTIVSNRADQRGGGILCDDYADVTVSNSILWDNLAAVGEQIALPQYNEDFATRELYVRYSNVEGGRSGVEGIGTPVDWQDGNIDTDPLFAAPGHWDGDTWVEGDHYLKSYAGRWDPEASQWVMDSEHSSCIDAGDPAADHSAEPAYNGSRINMGTYGATEYASKTPGCPNLPIGDLDEDCEVTFADLAIMAAHWLECNLEPPIACE